MWNSFRKPPIRVKRSPLHGYGGFATRLIPEGTRIIEYLGERISHEEATRRYQEDQVESHHTFLFTVDEETVIDARADGNEARFINHCCDPNCEAVLEDGRIFFEALRDIARGEELTIDYQLERDEPYSEEWEDYYACNCGSPQCRGSLLATKYLRQQSKQSKQPKRSKQAKAAGGARR